MDSMRSTLPASQPSTSLLPNAFVGRRSELAELASAFQQHRLVTICGTGGVGKTRLAEEATGRAALLIPDAVHFVRLAAISDEAGAIQEIAQSMRISGAAEQLGAGIRAALQRGPQLLALDNLEHLELKDLIESLLEQCPQLTILATSRRPLRIDGEYVLRLDPFHLDDVGSIDAAALRQEPAIELFCRRASEAPRPVTMLDQQLPQIAEICRRVDGLPLAIELVVGWMRLLNPDELLAHLDRVLPRLRGVSTDDDARHQTMASTIQWSYDLLSSDEQRLFRRLSAFAGGFTIDMASRMAAGHSGVAQYPFCDGYHRAFQHPGYHGGDPTVIPNASFYPELALDPIDIDVLDRLKSLEESNLIQRVSSAGDESRYDLLGLFREFGRDQLAINGELDAAFHRQATIVLAIVEIWHEGIFVPDLRVWSHAEINQELPNLRQALGWSIRQGEAGLDAGVEIAQRLTGSTWMFWQSRGLVTEGRRWTEASYHFEHSTWSKDMKMPALGFLCWIQGDDDRAEDVLLDAVDRAGRASYIASQASGYLYLALVEWRCGADHFTRMKEHLTHSLALYHTVDDPAGLGICTLLTGIVDRLEGELPRALDRYAKAQVYFRIQQFEWGLASAVYYAADATLELATKDPGRFPEALKLFGDALQGYFDHGDWWGIGGVAGGIATAATYLGDQELAARLFGYSTALLRIVGAYLPPANLEFYQAIADHLRGQMGDERFMIAYQQGLAIPASEALSGLRLRLTKLAHSKPEPLPKLTDSQKRMVQQLVNGNPPKRIAELTGRTLASIYQMLQRICKKWGINTWEEIAPLAISRSYATPTPRGEQPSRKGWSK